MPTSPQQTTTAPTLAAGTWKLDAAHSNVVFSVRHLGLSKVRGRFDRFDAELTIGPSPDDVHVEATVEMALVNTNNPDRDNHLRNTDFFDVERNPTLQFTSSGLTGGDDGVNWQLAGDLTINGITRPVVLDVEFGGVENFQTERHAGFSATGELRRSEFGIDFGIMSIGVDRLALADRVPFELDLQFVEPTPQAG